MNLPYEVSARIKTAASVSFCKMPMTDAASGKSSSGNCNATCKKEKPFFVIIYIEMNRILLINIKNLETALLVTALLA